MAGSNRNNLGKEFERAFSEGISTNDWSVLNKVIVKSVDNFLDDVGDRMNDAMGPSVTKTLLSNRKEDFSGDTMTARAQRELHAERARIRKQLEEERNREERERREKNVKKKTELAFPYKNVDAVSSVAMSVAGGIGTGVCAVRSLVAILTGASFIMPVAFTAFFLYMLIRGGIAAKLSGFAKRVTSFIGKRQYIDIETISLYLNIPAKKILSRLRRMIDRGYFPQGHLDKDGKTLMLTDEVFEHYLDLEMKGKKDDVIDTTARDADEKEFPELSDEDSAQLSAMIKEGNRYIASFHELNADIPGVEVSAKLDRLEGLLKEIFVRVKEHPEQMSRIHELMDYYLPTAQKLVMAYRDYDRVSEPGKEILSAKKDIENTLDTINASLGKLLNKLFKDSVLDVTTDAQVLKTVLAQKGL